MECIIENSLRQQVAKGKKISVLIRYLRIHHKISISESTLMLRLKRLKGGMPAHRSQVC